MLLLRVYWKKAAKTHTNDQSWVKTGWYAGWLFSAKPTVAYLFSKT